MTLFTDYPSSFIADHYSRKLLVILGVILTALFYPFMLFPESIKLIITGYILYALGLSFVNGAIEGWLLNSLTNKNEYGKYIHFSTKIFTFGSIIAAIIGCLIAYVYQSYQSGYFISIIFMSLVLLSFVFINEDNKINSYDKKLKINKISHNMLLPIKILVNKKSISLILFINMLFGIGVALVFIYWQPILLNKKITMNQTIVFLFICYIGTFIAQYVSNNLIT